MYPKAKGCSKTVKIVAPLTLFGSLKNLVITALKNKIAAHHSNNECNITKK